jgi:hypothetical protein
MLGLGNKFINRSTRARNVPIDFLIYFIGRERACNGFVTGIFYDDI